MQAAEHHYKSTGLPLDQWHAEAGLTLSRLSGPAPSARGLLGVVVDARKSEISQVCLTVSSLLRGTVQRPRIQILLSHSADARPIAEWVAHEQQISLITSLAEVTPGEEYLMVIPAGVIAGAYSVEAAVECLDVSGAGVLRVLVDGVEGAVEVWRSAALGDAGDRSAAEARARAAGRERWISGASTGMHAVGRPAPKMFLRKGPAEKFEVRVLARDTAKADVKADYEGRLRELESQLARMKRKAANQANGNMDSARILNTAKKGPSYLVRRAAWHLRQRLTGRN